MSDPAGATSALEDRAGVVAMLEGVHPAVDDSLRPADIGVAVGREVHQVDHARTRRPGADLTEDDLAVGLAVPLHVRETGLEAERPQDGPPHLPTSADEVDRQI